MADSPALTLSPSRPARYGDVGFAVLVVAIIGMLIVPLPTWLLDILLTTNIATAVVLVLTSLYVPHPLRLSTFPSILLLATLFRLALNVSSTRLILSKGYAGEVIQSFGEFVVGGNFVVGAVIFLILTVIQFLVIAKGSERVAEVAARFTLDAMPGKQMAIDADLRAGAFGLDEARRRRSELQTESQLFGAMDGAMKFVKGDAIAGIIITVINVVGGLIIGVAQRDMSVTDAAQLYTLLTVGDGLVAQIPALLVSICAGIIVTRVSSNDPETPDLGTEVMKQLSATPRVYGIAAGLLVALGIVPGLPTVPFLLLAVASGVLSWRLTMRDRERERNRAEQAAIDASPQARSSEPQLVPAVTPIVVELGAQLSEVLRGDGGEAALRDEVQAARESFFQRHGVKLPGVRIRFGGRGLAPNQVRVLVHEVPELVAVVDPAQRLIAESPATLAEKGIAATATPHPVTGAPIALIASEAATAASAAGHEPVALPRHILLHAAAAAQRRASAFIGIAETQAALDLLEPTHGALVDAVVPRPVPIARLTGVLKRLVDEGVPVRDMRSILEALAEEADENRDVIELTEIARRGLARSITAPLARNGALSAWLVDAAIEQTVRESIRRDGGKPVLALAPRLTEDILRAFRGPLASRPERPIVVVAQDVRRYLRQLLLLEHPSIVVLGLSEVQAGLKLQPLGTVSVGRATGSPQAVS